ncbi:hypothetical protein QJS10_CPB14g01680 [Acorus calamus]|uniref:Uncharacterized protein n=1 Tax=Acorus calamus TaxID=4465 RepID=A0AAV9DBU1_ACOCL|nr:hypothetical protein QJS10_CPB14g01680 [Acorus calamus]
MAEDLDDGEFWLPSEFLADDAFMEKDLSARGSPLVDEKDLSCFPCEFPYDSAVSSPVESVTETESDEEDLVAGLARQMGSSAFAFENPKTRVMAGSPQSTLCSFGGRSRASSNGPSLVSSPPSPLESKNGDAWDLLYEAAGQVVRLRMNEESAMVNQQVHCRSLLCPPRNPSPPPPPPPPPVKTANLGLHLDQAFARRQLQAQQVISSAEETTASQATAELERMGEAAREGNPTRCAADADPTEGWRLRRLRRRTRWRSSPRSVQLRLASSQRTRASPGPARFGHASRISSRVWLTKGVRRDRRVLAPASRVTGRASQKTRSYTGKKSIAQQEKSQATTTTDQP